MKRSDFLKIAGLAGIGVVVPFKRARTMPRPATPKAELPEGVDCVLSPQEEVGPYPLDLHNNSAMFRQDITEGRAGLPFDMTLTVVNVNSNCTPITNARIDIWHCDKDGVYSGYAQPGANTVGQTFMRGIQMTDANGQVKFNTIYPGWYSGRVTHIHLQIFLNSILSATTQVAYPDDLTQTVYTTPLYAARGQNTSVVNNAADHVFNSPLSDLQYEIFTIAPNAATGGYDGTITIGMNAPAAGITTLEPETGGQFTLLQNAPNPVKSRTALGFTLAQSSMVELAIFDLTGQKVATLLNERRGAGSQTVNWDGTVGTTRLPAGNYVYQLSVYNSAGEFRQCKVLTLQ